MLQWEENSATNRYPERDILKGRIKKKILTIGHFFKLLLGFFTYRKISYSKDIQLNAVSMQKILLKTSDLGQVCLYNVCIALNFCSVCMHVSLVVGYSCAWFSLSLWFPNLSYPVDQ